MKKLFLTVLGMALIASPVLHAQSIDGIGITVEKINVDKLKSAIAKSDAEIADAKKAAKAATWIKRGEVLIDADAKPVNGLFPDLEETMLKLTYGESEPTPVTVAGTEFQLYTYEHFKAYVLDGKVKLFIPVTVIDPAALDKAYDAFAKAYELDASKAKKVNEGMANIHNKSTENGTQYYTLGEYKIAADNFRRAYKASAHPALDNKDTLSLYYAGMLGTIAEDYQGALRDLNEVIALGHEEGGEAYYYKFHCLYNLGDQQGAIETLKHAVSLYPDNDNIIEGLMSMYAMGDEDPSELVPIVQNAITQNPSNPALYLGLARIYDKLGQIDNAIASARKASELAPQDFFATYFTGLYIVKKGDNMDVDVRNMTFTSNSQYQQALAVVDQVYIEALPTLERAYELNKTEIVTVELLKNLAFRLRDKPGMTEKYEKYDAIFRSMNGE